MSTDNENTSNAELEKIGLTVIGGLKELLQISGKVYAPLALASLIPDILTDYEKYKKGQQILEWRHQSLNLVLQEIEQIKRGALSDIIYYHYPIPTDYTDYIKEYLHKNPAKAPDHLAKLNEAIIALHDMRLSGDYTKNELDTIMGEWLPLLEKWKKQFSKAWDSVQNEGKSSTLSTDNENTSNAELENIGLTVIGGLKELLQISGKVYAPLALASLIPDILTDYEKYKKGQQILEWRHQSLNLVLQEIEQIKRGALSDIIYYHYPIPTDYTDYIKEYLHKNPAKAPDHLAKLNEAIIALHDMRLSGDYTKDELDTMMGEWLPLLEKWQKQFSQAWDAVQKEGKPSTTNSRKKKNLSTITPNLEKDVNEFNSIFKSDVFLKYGGKSLLQEDLFKEEFFASNNDIMSSLGLLIDVSSIIGENYANEMPASSLFQSAKSSTGSGFTIGSGITIPLNFNINVSGLEDNEATNLAIDNKLKTLEQVDDLVKSAANQIDNTYSIPLNFDIDVTGMEKISNLKEDVEETFQELEENSSDISSINSEMMKQFQQLSEEQQNAFSVDMSMLPLNMLGIGGTPFQFSMPVKESEDFFKTLSDIADIAGKIGGAFMNVDENIGKAIGSAGGLAASISKIYSAVSADPLEGIDTKGMTQKQIEEVKKQKEKQNGLALMQGIQGAFAGLQGLFGGEAESDTSQLLGGLGGVGAGVAGLLTGNH